MLYKPRTKSTELLVLEYLNTRMTLSLKDKKYYLKLKKGYEGEKNFDKLLEQFKCECLILNDLLLKINNTTFQIDSLIIMAKAIYFFEVKNLDGDYYYESERFYKLPKIEISNPLHQLGRSESLLRQLLFTHGYNLPIDASVVFINPEFTLYQSPLNKPIIYPTQLNCYLNELNNSPSGLHSKHKILAEKLVSLHINDSPYKQIPNYEYDQLRKGITCFNCSSFSVSIKGSRCLCMECAHEEVLANAIKRSIKEFKLLFPDIKITTTNIQEWCQVVKSSKTIRSVLNQNYKIIGSRRWAFYK